MFKGNVDRIILTKFSRENKSTIATLCESLIKRNNGSDKQNNRIERKFAVTKDTLEWIFFNMGFSMKNLTKMISTFLDGDGPHCVIIYGIKIISIDHEKTFTKHLKPLTKENKTILISQSFEQTVQWYRFLFDNPPSSEMDNYYLSPKDRDNNDKLYDIARMQHFENDNKRHLIWNEFILNYLVQNIQGDEMNHILVFSSFVLWTRNISDIDLMMYRDFDELSINTQIALMPFIIFVDKYFKDEVKMLIEEIEKEYNKSFFEVLEQFSNEEGKVSMTITDIKNKFYCCKDIGSFIISLQMICCYGNSSFLNIMKQIGPFWNDKHHWFNLVDFSIKGTITWPSYWDSYLNNWAKKQCKLGLSFKPQSFDDIIYNRKCYFWYKGVIKVVKLQVEITRRRIRASPSSIADLLFIQDNIWYMIIPNIQKKKTDFKKLKYCSLDKIKLLLDDGYQYNSNGLELYKEIIVDMDHFYNTIQLYLKRRYNISMDINSIKANIKKYQT